MSSREPFTPFSAADAGLKSGQKGNNFPKVMVESTRAKKDPPTQPQSLQKCTCFKANKILEQRNPLDFKFKPVFMSIFNI